VLLSGSGLVSCLGGNLNEAVAFLRQHDFPVAVGREIVPGECWPHFAIAPSSTSECEEATSWYDRARELICRVIAEAGVAAAAERSVPLFIASSSINIGALEHEEGTGPDCLQFSERIAGWLDWTGPVFWVSTACTSGINALRSAQRLIESGEAEAAVVLGFEFDNRYSAAGFAGMQLLAPLGEGAPKPLAADRKGLVLGDAIAAIRLFGSTCKKIQAMPLLVAQSAVHVSPTRWRLRGGANRIDGRDPAGASALAVAAMARDALREAGLRPEQIDLIKLQAAGSPHNDGVEIAGLREVFSPLPPLCSLKPLLGHTLGAAGVAETALLLGCLDAGVWPPQRNGAPDPALAARLADPADPAREAPRFVMAIILGFGGGHACLVVEKLGAAVMS